MRTLTQNEIHRTAFKYIPKKIWHTEYGYIRPDFDKNQMCPYCKNEDTDVVRDKVALAPFTEYYGEKVEKFTVVHCWCCAAMWSFYTPKLTETTEIDRLEARIEKLEICLRECDITHDMLNMPNSLAKLKSKIAELIGPRL